MSASPATAHDLARGPMRVGVVGTGYWATWCHGAVLADRDDIELVGFWGRDLDRARRAAAATGQGGGYDDLGRLLDEVEAVSFAVSPEIQASTAVRAARAGKHLLLDKPLSLDLSTADEVAEAVIASGVISVSFMTLLFQRRFRDWLAEARRLADESGPWEGVSVTWAGTIDEAGSPYANSVWRRTRGGLWDLGPHALSVVDQLLPPIETLTAVRGPRDTVHVASAHQDGALSTFTVTLTAPPGTEEARVEIWGPAGRSNLALPTDTLREAFSSAVDEWLAAIAAARPHDLDVSYGRGLVAVLDAAERSLANGTAVRPR
jgi:predicted dehydrogenase